VVAAAGLGAAGSGAEGYAREPVSPALAWLLTGGWAKRLEQRKKG
jgi:hypothetical protein